MKEFNDWEMVTPKTYPALKTFIVAVYTHRILSQQLRNMAGQDGVCAADPQHERCAFNKDDAPTATDGTITALNLMAMTTGSTLVGAQATAIPESIANAIY